MRRRADAGAVRELAAELGRLARHPATVYLVGGATAVVEGWRPTTVDVDLVIEPDHDALLRLIPQLKERLDISIELASPRDFLPEPPGWRDRSPFVAQEGLVTIRHLDPTFQALAKLERGFDQDLADVRSMLGRGLVDAEGLRGMLDAIEPQLFRFPSVDAAALRAAVDGVLA